MDLDLFRVVSIFGKIFDVTRFKIGASLFQPFQLRIRGRYRRKLYLLQHGSVFKEIWKRSALTGDSGLELLYTFASEEYTFVTVSEPIGGHSTWKVMQNCLLHS